MRLDDRVLLLDKPAGLTSFGAVRRLRRAAELDKAGHSGSLDPLATGLLVVCTGVATRVASLFVELPKIYEARVRFGRATDSYDADGVTVATSPVPPLARGAVESALADFVGDIEQRPPMVSAVKVQGQRLYELARRGVEVERAPRRVTVHELQLESLGVEHADLRIRCGRGCYVRSIAHELGEKLGVPAHLEALRRAAVGRFEVRRAASLASFEALEGLDAAVLTVPEALEHLPALQVRASYEASIRNGVQPGPQALLALPQQAGLHRLLSGDGRRLLGLAAVASRAGAVRLSIVFATPLESGETESA
jgi:tRNA pseudouridine55 synthase